MFVAAIVLYTLGGLSFLLAAALMLLGVKKPERRYASSWAGALGQALEELPYALRIFFRWAYLILLPLGGLLHYLSLG